MTEDKGILIQNIYYMLSYAFQVLKQENYRQIAGEHFENIQDLFAAILAKGIAQQLKRGLYREYIPKAENLSVLRGKLNIQETLNNRLRQRQQLGCEYDELSENNIYNQILCTTADILIRDPGVAAERRQALKRVILFFDGIDAVDPSAIHWNTLSYHRSNQTYRMLMNICYFVLDDMLQTTEQGQHRMREFSDEHMERLYEKFILEYYRAHHPQLRPAPAQVKWDLDENNDERALLFLPAMQTDITLRGDVGTLIIDAKYYGRIMLEHHNSETVRSAHLYQIYAYVKNMDVNHTGDVSGVLLYARTGEELIPDFDYNIGGNRIGVKTLDLNKPFALIAEQLDRLVSGL